ncbi:tetratricopeptide repeat protein [Chloroflexi bacterium TSY]|nr:tetratricopeptide repeat protein [Chloroflexi bacterium TSY]
MAIVDTFIPNDRRRALAEGELLPNQTCGAVLFADMSGSTPLTEALAVKFGARRGADVLARHLNTIYNSIIAQVHQHGGVVIGFSGDAITCWFDANVPDDQRVRISEYCKLNNIEETGRISKQNSTRSESDLILSSIYHATEHALSAAQAVQGAMKQFEQYAVTSEVTVSFTIKTAVAAGTVHRFAVGDPNHRLVDALAGSLMDRVSAAEQNAMAGELILDATTAEFMKKAIKIRMWRTDDEGQQFAIVDELYLSPLSFSNLPFVVLTREQTRPWILPPVYERLQSGQDRFFAELRPATALFVKFSGINYDLDPDAGKKLDRYIRQVQEVLDRYEGVLIQLTSGDKGSYLYAAFGAPFAHDDDPARAAAAALDIRAISETNESIERIQIGITQGRMRVGAYGSQTRQTYGVLGDATNLAARLMSSAVPGEIWINANIADEISHTFVLDDLGPMTFRGKEDAYQIYRVEGRRTRLGSQVRAHYTNPLVGRQVELEQVVRLLDEISVKAANGEEEGKGQGKNAQQLGHILRIEGSAGVGKSHFAATIAQLAHERELMVVVGACQSTSRDMAYFPIRQMARHLLQLPAMIATSKAEQQEQITRVEALVQEMNSEWLLRLPLLGDLLGLPIPDNATTAAFDSQLRQEALTTLALDILQAGAQCQPLLLLLEDAHWIDEASQAVTLALGRVVANTPILLVIVHRPSLDIPELQNDQFLAEAADLLSQMHILLDELSSVGTAALIENRLGGIATPLALDLIYAQAQGNPFFTEELVDALVEAGRLIWDDDARRSGGWSLSATMIRALHAANCLVRQGDEWTIAPDAPLANADLGVPDTVHGIVLTRLDRLPGPINLTVKVASVIGHVFEFDILAAAHPEQPATDTLLEQIAILEHRDLAQLETEEPNRVYIFKHNITQEVAYGTLLETQRHELHLAVATKLEEQQPEAIERLAHHFHASDTHQPDVRAKTLHYLDRAGQRAKRDYANETALSYFDRALALEERWEWLKGKVEVLHVLGRREEERTALVRLENALNVPDFEAAFLWGEYYESLSDYTEAQNAFTRATRVGHVSNNKQEEARAQFRLGMIAWRQGNYERAEKIFTRSLMEIENKKNPRREEAEIHYGLGLIYREQGQYEKSATLLERTLHLNRLLDSCILSRCQI